MEMELFNFQEGSGQTVSSKGLVSVPDPTNPSTDRFLYCTSYWK